MMYFFLFLVLLSALALSSASFITPLMLNVWLSMLTGMMVFLLSLDAAETGALLLLFVEEALSLALILCWLLFASMHLLLLIVFVKGALPPFHLWLMAALRRARGGALLWGLTGHKSPLFLLWSKIGSGAGAYLIMSGLFGAALTAAVAEMFSLLVISSGNTIATLLFLVSYFWLIGLLLLLCYCSVLWLGGQYETIWFASLLFWLGLLGAPPLFFFQMKWSVLSILWAQSATATVSALIAGSICVAVAYLRLLLLLLWQLPTLAVSSHDSAWFWLSSATATQ